MINYMWYVFFHIKKEMYKETLLLGIRKALVQLQIIYFIDLFNNYIWSTCYESDVYLKNIWKYLLTIRGYENVRYVFVCKCVCVCGVSAGYCLFTLNISILLWVWAASHEGTTATDSLIIWLSVRFWQWQFPGEEEREKGAWTWDNYSLNSCLARSL